jgi:hypothetical protein
MTRSSEIPEAKIIRRLTRGDPKRGIVWGALLLPLPVGIVSVLMLGMLELLGNGTSAFASIASEPLKWTPELVIWALTVIYAIAGITVGRKVTQAAHLHSFRAVAHLLLTLTFFDAGSRFLTATVDPIGLLIVGGGLALSILALLSIPSSTKARLSKSRERGSIYRYLNLQDWSWTIRAPFEPRIDAEDREATSLASRLTRLHWLAPAAGTYLARSLADDQTLLVFGVVFLFIALIGANGLMREIGITLQLRDWGYEAGKPIRLG